MLDAESKIKMLTKNIADSAGEKEGGEDEPHGDVDTMTVSKMADAHPDALYQQCRISNWIFNITKLYE